MELIRPCMEVLGLVAGIIGVFMALFGTGDLILNGKNTSVSSATAAGPNTGQTLAVVGLALLGVGVGLIIIF